MVRLSKWAPTRKQQFMNNETSLALLESGGSSPMENKAAQHVGILPSLFPGGQRRANESLYPEANSYLASRSWLITPTGAEPGADNQSNQMWWDCSVQIKTSVGIVLPEWSISPADWEAPNENGRDAKSFSLWWHPFTKTFDNQWNGLCLIKQFIIQTNF